MNTITMATSVLDSVFLDQDYLSFKQDQDYFSNGYIRMDPLSRNELIDVMNVCRNKYFPIRMFLPKDYRDDDEAYFKDVIDFEDHHAYSFTKGNRNNRYAIKLTMLLPKQIRTLKDKRKFLYRYMRRLCADSFAMNYAAYSYTKGRADYICVIVYERRHINQLQTKKYSHNRYLHKETRQQCKAKDPCAVLQHKRGEPVLDKNGNKQKEHRLFSDKNRVFVYTSFAYFRRWLFDILYSVSRILLDPEKKRKKFKLRIQQDNIKGYEHRYMQKNIQVINHAKRMIEEQSNEMILDLLEEARTMNLDYSNKREKDYIPKSILDKIKSIESIFWHYKVRLLSQCYTNEEGNRIDINPHKKYPGSITNLEHNVMSLVKMFQNDLSRQTTTDE